MASNANQWMLFGYDMSRLGQHWLGAWGELLFAPGSPLRRRLDEPVALLTDDGERLYQDGTALQAGVEPDSTECRALLVPDDLVLVRELCIPLAAEAELASVIALECAASSPFPGDDTVSGWRECGRSEQGIRIALAIAARSDLAAWMDRQAAPPGCELWAEVGGAMVTLNGFGEGRRDAAYRRRLLRCAVTVGGILLLALLSAALFAFQQGVALERSGNRLAAVETQSVAAARAREELVASNALIAAANAVVAEHPNPHQEIVRLTRQLGDDAFIAHFSMRGRLLRVRGRAVDAAGVMQTLVENPEYSSVTAPQAISALGDSGVQQFYLDIAIGPETES